MMNKCALLVVEGSRTEPTIFKSIFEKYGYTFIHMPQKGEWESYKVEISKNKIIYLVQGKKNRLNNLFDEYQVYDTLSVVYGIKDVVALNYIIYDFDYVTKDKMKKLQEKFNAPDTGEMLLSNPCIEVIAENNLNNQHIGHSSEYKKKIRKQINDSGYSGRTSMQLIDSYICDNFEDLMIKHIKRNCEFFNTTNISVHPSKLINYVMETNAIDEDKEKFEFYYLSTVVYVAIAELEGLTKEIDNANTVIEFFEQKKINKSSGF